MAQDLTNKYFVKNTASGTYTDITTLVDGVRILKVEGMTKQGTPKNVYTASWEYEEDEDFAIVMQNSTDTTKIIRECVDIDITFIIKQKYATNTIDVRTQHKTFIDYMTNTDVWIKSTYTNLIAHCYAKGDYKPTTEKYARGTDSWITGTISMHCIDKITTIPTT